MKETPNSFVKKNQIFGWKFQFLHSSFQDVTSSLRFLKESNAVRVPNLPGIYFNELNNAWGDLGEDMLNFMSEINAIMQYLKRLCADFIEGSSEIGECICLEKYIMLFTATKKNLKINICITESYITCVLTSSLCTYFQSTANAT